MLLRLALSVVSLHRKDVHRLGFLALTAIAGLSLLAAAPATAQDRPIWRIVEQSGDVEMIQAGTRPVALAGTGALDASARIRTGADGRVVLRRGTDMLIVAPNSMVQLPPANETAFTRVMQLLGSIFVRIERGGDDAFEVRTPFLVAVVKGTIFTVSTAADGGRVHVAQGLVDVSDPLTGMTYSLAAGQAIQLGGGTPSLQAAGDAVMTSLPASSRFARDVAASTGGLLSLETTRSNDGDAAAAASGTPIDLPPGLVDIAPSAGILRGLGGNRARGGAPPSTPPPAAATGGGAGGAIP